MYGTFYGQYQCKGLVAQLGSVAGFYSNPIGMEKKPEGRGFESRRARHALNANLNGCRLCRVNQRGG